MRARPMLSYLKFQHAIFIIYCLLAPLISTAERNNLINQNKVPSDGSCYTLDCLALINSPNFECLKYYFTNNSLAAARLITGGIQQFDAIQTKRHSLFSFGETDYFCDKYGERIIEFFDKIEDSRSHYPPVRSQQLTQTERLKFEENFEEPQNVIYQQYEARFQINAKPDSIEEIDGFDEIYSMAPAAKIEIDNLADVIAAMNGGRVAKVPIKSKDRARIKIINDYGGDPTRITDLARNTIIVPKDNIKAVVGMLQSKGATLKITDGTLDPLGYSGVNSKIKTKVGLIAEIQVNSPEMIYAKESPEIAKDLLGEDVYDSIASKSPTKGGKGHELYEKWRSLDEDDPHRKDLEVESKMYYESIRSKVMSVKTGDYLNLKNVYIDYSFESVMFRRDKKTKNIYRKFYGEREHSNPIPHNNRLFNDAILYGQEITRKEYLEGKGEGEN
ncbi:hypothetical protein [Microbulbifer variabilis]|uniref:hypothetical protein n=1 Tax=Microbulbifer variabilis TaxID=266805 RepID=UPI001CFD3935|nr:hypothetical protein [Microbulbifer variabilis]